jgi:hypothetical protein
MKDFDLVLVPDWRAREREREVPMQWMTIPLFHLPFNLRTLLKEGAMKGCFFIFFFAFDIL